MQTISSYLSVIMNMNKYFFLKYFSSQTFHSFAESLFLSDYQENIILIPTDNIDPTKKTKTIVEGIKTNITKTNSFNIPSSFSETNIEEINPTTIITTIKKPRTFSQLISLSPFFYDSSCLHNARAYQFDIQPSNF